LYACGQKGEFHETKLTANQSANPPMVALQTRRNNFPSWMRENIQTEQHFKKN
jgi:hypothetical protein